MNTEKIEKLKKSLSNSKIPADLKPKIEAEIKRLESLDDLANEKAKEEKEEAKEEAKPVAKTRKPRAKKTTTAKPSQTSKPKRTAMSLAKEIRKEGESWKEAQARASKMMKEGSKEVAKTVETELDKLSKLVKSKKELRSQIGRTNLLIDAKRKAKPMGRRISKDGNVYYENRANRTDRGTYGKYHLAEGGYLTDPTFGGFQNQVYAGGGGIGKNTDVILSSNTKDKLTWRGIVTPNVLEDIKEFQYQGGHKRYEIDIYDENLLEKPNKENINKLNGFLNKIGIMFGTVFVYAEDYATGGSITNERRYVNKDEDYEVRYSKPILRRKGYQGKRDFELGGTVVTDLAGHTSGGDAGFNAGMPLNGFSNTSYTGLVGETGAMSSGELFMAGGSVDKNFDLVGFKRVGMFDTLEEAKTFANIERKQYSNFDVVVIKDNVRTSKPFLVFSKLKKGEYIGNRVYENGGGLPSGSEQSYMITESFGNPAQHYAKGGGVRRVGNREYSYGRNWTNDHRHVNKGEDHEVNYTRKRKFLGIFNDGGGVGKWSVTDISNAKYLGVIEFQDMNEEFHNFELMETDDRIVFGGMTNTGFIESGYIEKDGFSTDEVLQELISDLEVYYNDGAEYTSSIVFNQRMANGGAVTNERRYVNKGEDYEVRYAKPRPSRKGYKGARKFMAGGMNNETPRIYVADLEAYNNGRLVGEWLDLSDYNDADELMDAIQDVLKKSGGEEYAIHDYENFPSILYSEYMSRNDFQALYDVMETAKRNDLPLEVVQDIVSQYGEGGVEEFYGKFDSAEDFAYQQVEEMGIESFNDFQYYLDIYETDRRLLSQEMADSYVDDIRDEDGGNRLIEEAGMDVLEYQEADSQTQEEMLDNAREIVYDEYFDNWYEGLSDPYYFLVEEQGMYSPDDFAKANFVRVDYEKLGDALEQDYTFIEYDGDLYVFNIR